MGAQTGPTKIIIADEVDFYRDGVTLLIEKKHRKEIELVSEASTGVELIEEVRKYRPQVVIASIRMPEMDGVQACQIIKAKYPATRVLGLCPGYEEESIKEMIRAGADGCLLKRTSKAEIITAIKTVAGGKAYYCPAISSKLFHVFECRSQSYIKKNSFTVQEIKIIHLICKESTTKEIARQLGLCTRTVDDYRHKIQGKIGARNMSGIITYAIKNKLVKLD